MLEEIFSNEDSTSSQPFVDWNLPPIYDEYTDDGFLIVQESEVAGVIVYEKDSRFEGSEIELVEVQLKQSCKSSSFKRLDLFFFRIPRPLTFDVQIHDLKIEVGKWIPFEDYAAQPFAHEHEPFNCISKSHSIYCLWVCHKPKFKQRSKGWKELFGLPVDRGTAFNSACPNADLQITPILSQAAPANATSSEPIVRIGSGDLGTRLLCLPPRRFIRCDMFQAYQAKVDLLVLRIFWPLQSSTRMLIPGEIPQQLGKLKLEVLQMQNDGLTGLVPPVIFNISSLSYISLVNNTLSGSLPMDICHRLPLLERLFLFNNKFTGSLPTSIGNCSLLKDFSLSRNNFTGDYGITKLLHNHESMAQTKTLATIGYIAPEYGSEGIVSTKGDVYSYGVLLLETFSRKKPTDEMFVGETSLKQWVKESLPCSVIEVIDPNMLRREDEHFTVKEHCIKSIMELAISCCAESQDERVNMKDVHTTLTKIKVEFLTKTQGPRHHNKY
ncbi:hypothetical protein Vadar_012482 [Vaccinium darrowii]|uniref:Uncharacterized protein n=1 Tax=Vaccinium darrowii TaxID=229202 RepID=A0ACB7X9T1_9ERIC|nr:hypothetical protein Vadar_012482 [Vaccinium darrowii]